MGNLRLNSIVLTFLCRRGGVESGENSTVIVEVEQLFDLLCEVRLLVCCAYFSLLTVALTSPVQLLYLKPHTILLVRNHDEEIIFIIIGQTSCHH